jgi:hypothetical protein
MFGKNLAKKFAPQIKQAIANQAKPNPSQQLASRGAQAVMSAMKKRGFADGGKVASASKRADGCATKGKTKGTMITMKGGGYAC